MKKALITTICNYMRSQDNVYMLTGDLGFGVMNPILEEFPERFFNLGICEQNMASVAAGMGMDGNVAFVYSIGNFPTLRCLEQIRNDVAYHHANVKIISVGGGFAYGNLGMSHHATEDIAIMRSIPGMMVLSPADPNETVEAVRIAMETDGPVYIRLGRGGEANLQEQTKLDGNHPVQLTSGSKIAVLSTGVITKEVLAAAEILKQEGVEISTYSVPVIKPLNIEIVQKLAKENDVIFTVEEHTIDGGFGGAIAEIVGEMTGCKATVRRIGMKNEFTSVVGSPDYLRHYYGMDRHGIIENIKKFCEE